MTLYDHSCTPASPVSTRPQCSCHPTASLHECRQPSSLAQSSQMLSSSAAAEGVSSSSAPPSKVVAACRRRRRSCIICRCRRLSARRRRHRSCMHMLQPYAPAPQRCDRTPKCRARPLCHRLQRAKMSQMLSSTCQSLACATTPVPWAPQAWRVQSESEAPLMQMTTVRRRKASKLQCCGEIG